MAGNGTGGPWGNGGGNRGPGNNGGGDRPPSNGGQGPDLDDLVRKGQEQLRVLMGGRGGAKIRIILQKVAAVELDLALVDLD